MLAEWTSWNSLCLFHGTKRKVAGVALVEGDFTGEVSRELKSLGGKLGVLVEPG